MHANERLFSYGALQQEDVQLATFGRRLPGHQDHLHGYRHGLEEIDDSGLVKTSGKTHHPIISHTGRPADVIAGAVLEITRHSAERHACATTASVFRWIMPWIACSMPVERSAGMD